MYFEFTEDQVFFEQRLCGPGESIEEYSWLFDFRPPDVKRREFNNIRDRRMVELTERFGRTCLLRHADDCDAARGLVIDHLIPLSSNRLNKELRGVGTSRSSDGRLRKAPTQSFGSNHSRNHILACQPCNSLKQNKLLERDVLRRVLAMTAGPPRSATGGT